MNDKWMMTLMVGCFLFPGALWALDEADEAPAQEVESAEFQEESDEGREPAAANNALPELPQLKTYRFEILGRRTYVQLAQFLDHLSQKAGNDTEFIQKSISSGHVRYDLKSRLDFEMIVKLVQDSQAEGFQNRIRSVEDGTIIVELG